MDPVTTAVRAFQDAFREFRRDERSRVLRVATASKDVASLAKLLRAEEWRADNSSPFVILETAIGVLNDALPAFGAAIREHYELVRRGLADDGVTVEPFSSQFPLPVDLVTAVVNDIAELQRKLAPPLASPLVCFVPVKVDAPPVWHDVFLRMLGPIIDLGVRVVVADASNDEALAEALRPLGPIMDETSFVIDDAAADAAAKGALLAATRGAGPWVVGPAVTPPPRPSRPQPTEEQLQAAVAAAGLAPVLSQAEGSRLRAHVMKAAEAVAASDAATALEEQARAVELCRNAGVALETVLMTMVLAGYQYQFGKHQDAEQTYRTAGTLAAQSNAWAQAAQAQMALGYLLLGAGRRADAANSYAQAVGAAERADASLLFLESARMAGRCWVDSGDHERAAHVWRAAVEKGKDMSALEIRSSTLLDVADSLVALLDQQGASADARAVEATIADINRKFEQ